MSKVTIRAEGLTKTFPIRGGFFSKTTGNFLALENVNLLIEKGKALGLVGESGAGKSTLGRLLVRLIEPDSGRIYFKGVNISNLSPRRFRPLRQRMQIVFQDPYNSLNPRLNVHSIVSEGLEVFTRDRRKINERVGELMELVGLPYDAGTKYPHEFSGGQRQRISIARALALRPEFLVLDEPVSSLDISTAAGIIEFLAGIKERLGISMLFITHDLRMAEVINDRLAVMYKGRIIEEADTSEIFNNPLHPYTQTLLESVPRLEVEIRQRIPINVFPPFPAKGQSIPGCRFYFLCYRKKDFCLEEEPALIEARPGHFVACLKKGA
jgi:peptide/nickel transport system ATP-binding protein